MDRTDLSIELIDALSKVYFMEAFSHLTEFLQGELMILYYLLENEDNEISPSDLSETLHISRPRITTALTGLRQKGLVSTDTSKEDRRRVYVDLTPKGKAYVQERKDNVEEYFNRYVDGLGEENTKELIRLINLSVDIMTDK